VPTSCAMHAAAVYHQTYLLEQLQVCCCMLAHMPYAGHVYVEKLPSHKHWKPCNAPCALTMLQSGAPPRCCCCPSHCSLSIGCRRVGWLSLKKPRMQSAGRSKAMSGIMGVASLRKQVHSMLLQVR